MSSDRRSCLTYPSVKSEVTLGHLSSLLQHHGTICLEILENLTQLTVLIGKLRLDCLKELFIQVTVGIMII